MAQLNFFGSALQSYNTHRAPDKRVAPVHIRPSSLGKYASPVSPLPPPNSTAGGNGMATVSIGSTFPNDETRAAPNDNNNNNNGEVATTRLFTKTTSHNGTSVDVIIQTSLPPSQTVSRQPSPRRIN
jgi:hypothetical protein